MTPRRMLRTLGMLCVRPDGQVGWVRPKEGFGVIKPPLGAGMLEILAECIGSALSLCEGLGGIACLAWTQELPQTMWQVFHASMYFNHSMVKLHG